MDHLILAVPISLAIFIAWSVLSPNELAGRRLYQHVDTGKLYLYECRCDDGGHRSARQDWWQEVQLTGRGSYRRVGALFQRNVGYTPSACEAQPFPYLPLRPNQVAKLDLKARERLNPAMYVG